MKVRNFCLAAVLLLALAFGSNQAKADGTATDITSNGRIVYGNGTPEDTSDDIVIYDSQDLKLIETKIRGLESRLEAAEEAMR